MTGPRRFDTVSGMGLAYPQCPYVMAHAAVGPLRDELLKLPGVKISGSRLIIPHHAVGLVNDTLNGTPVSAASWVGAPPASVDWDEVDALLRAGGETREFVLDGFLMPFQKAAL